MKHLNTLKNYFLFHKFLFLVSFHPISFLNKKMYSNLFDFHDLPCLGWFVGQFVYLNRSIIGGSVISRTKPFEKCCQVIHPFPNSNNY